MRLEKRRKMFEASYKRMVDRVRQKSVKSHPAEEDRRGEEMIDPARGTKVRPKGLTVYGDTGGQGGEAVQIVPSLSGESEIPPYLNATAQQEWSRIIKLLRDLGTLSPAHGPAPGHLNSKTHSE